MGARVPMPPLPLANRVGSLAEAEDPDALYEQIGAQTREQILRMLPAGYELEGGALLDFGCGAGRTLRHFLDEANSAEIWGCDIDEESIDWLERNLCPPLHVLRSEAAPGLPFEDGRFDVAWALSVFTHLVDTWAAWLLELHRVLADDGILIATSLGPHQSEVIAQEHWAEDRIGMNALRHWASWEVGGPVVLHSTWWLRAHWGRAFEVLEIDESGPALFNHRWLALRKRDVTLTVEDLERPEPGEPREFSAMRHNVQQLRRELDRAQKLRVALNAAQEGNQRKLEALTKANEDRTRLRAALEATARRLHETESSLRDLERSRSWRITHTLRAAGAAFRRLWQRGTTR